MDEPSQTQTGQQIAEKVVKLSVLQNPSNTSGQPEEHHVDTRPHKHPTLKLWAKAFLFSGLVFCLCSGYLYMSVSEESLVLFNQAAGFAGFLVMGLSMALSGLAYFWDFADGYIIYRRYLGVVGFAYALLHSLFGLVNYFNLLMIRDWLRLGDSGIFDLYFNWPMVGSFTLSNIWAFVSGLVALVIFTMMAAISNNWSIRRLGLWWRRLLRVGYAAYFLTIIHFGIKRVVVWQDWLVHWNKGLPPLSLPVVIFGLGVLVLRLVLQVSVMKKRRLAVMSKRGPTGNGG